MIVKAKDSAKASRAEIKQFQSGAYKPLKTRFAHFNTICHGGLTKQRIVTIGALSSFGKSHILRQIEEDIFNEELNPGSKENVILIKCDFEMTKTEYYLAKVHERTGRDYEDLLYSIPDEEVKKAFNDVYNEISADYIYETFDTYSPDNFSKEITPFLEQFINKGQVVLTIDNLNLVEGEDEGKTMTKMMNHLIALKRKFKNLTIIQLAQLNRELKLRQEDPRKHFPMTTDFYHSSKIEHASDIQIVIHNPYLLGCTDYGAVKPERYAHLGKYLIADTRKKYSVFRTKGLMFFHYVKVRMKNSLKDFQDVHIEEIFKVEENDFEIKPNTAFDSIAEPEFNADPNPFADETS